MHVTDTLNGGGASIMQSQPSPWVFLGGKPPGGSKIPFFPCVTYPFPDVFIWQIILIYHFNLVDVAIYQTECSALQGYEDLADQLIFFAFPFLGMTTWRSLRQ